MGFTASLCMRPAQMDLRHPWPRADDFEHQTHPSELVFTADGPLAEDDQTFLMACFFQ